MQPITQFNPQYMDYKQARMKVWGPARRLEQYANKRSFLDQSGNSGDGESLHVFCR